MPLCVVSPGANRHDSPLLGATLQAATDQVGAHWPSNVTVHLDAGYDSNITRTLLDGLGLHGEIARKGVPAPVQAGKRWVAERTHTDTDPCRQAFPPVRCPDRRRGRPA
jgi:hypothetical protein